MQINSNQQRISVIKGMMKCAFLLGIVIVAYVLLRSDNGVSPSSNETVQIAIKSDVFAAKADYMQLELVAGRPLLILKYNSSDKACLGLEQTDTDWFVAWAQGTDLACPLKRIDASTASTRLGYKVCRGLQDQCRGSVYDLQGQVYPKQLAKDNLQIPLYKIVNNGVGTLLTIDAP